MHSRTENMNSGPASQIPHDFSTLSSYLGINANTTNPAEQTNLHYEDLSGQMYTKMSANAETKDAGNRFFMTIVFLFNFLPTHFDFIGSSHHGSEQLDGELV